MTALELQQALAKMPSRLAQALIFRCVEGRTPQQCAALYGIGVPQWEILFLDAACALANQSAPLPDAARATLAAHLQAELTQPPSATLPPSRAALALILHREEVHHLLLETERAAAASPARVREGWLRRLAVVLIIAVSLFVWLRERNKPPPPAQSHFPLPPREVR